MNNGYILVYRKINDSFHHREKYCSKMAWIDLLLLANWKDGCFYVRDVRVELKRGQVGWSEVQLADRWMWSRGRVRRFLAVLQDEHRIVQHKTHVTSIIEIINYDQYQSTVQQIEQQTEQQAVQQAVQQTVHGLKKENEEEKKERGRPKIDWPQKIAAIQSALTNIWQMNLANYKAKYPGLDHDLEFMGMLDWVKRKPREASKYTDWNLFIQKWLARCTPKFTLLKNNPVCRECNGTGKVKRHTMDSATNKETIIEMECPVCRRKYGTQGNPQ